MVLHGHKSNTAVAHPLPPAAGIAKGNKKAARASSAASSFPFAERGGFEPPEPTRSSTVFETAPFDHSGISPSILQFGLQIYAEAESNANEFIQFALPRRNSICGRQAKYTQKPEANEFFQSYQNFHPGFCNVEIMTHICRKKRRRNVPRQPDSTVTFNLWFYDTDR